MNEQQINLIIEKLKYPDIVQYYGGDNKLNDDIISILEDYERMNDINQANSEVLSNIPNGETLDEIYGKIDDIITEVGENDLEELKDMDESKMAELDNNYDHVCVEFE